MTSDKAREIIEKITAGEYDYHDSKRIVVKNEAVREMFEGLKVYPFYTTNSKGNRVFTDTKHEDEKCYVSIKNNKRYADHFENKKYIDFDDSIKGYISRNDIIDAMTIFGCTSKDTPSIEFIQWEDNFLMLVKSRNCIGAYKSFVSKNVVFEIFGIEV